MKKNQNDRRSIRTTKQHGTASQLQCEASNTFDEVSNIKEEPNIEYVLIIPSITENIDMPKPIMRKPKCETRIISCKVKISKRDEMLIKETATKNKRIDFFSTIYTCKKCPDLQIFKNRQDFKDHCILTHSGKDLVCEFCHKTYKYLNSLKVHSCKNKRLKSMKYKTCNKEFKSVESLAQHFSIHLDEMKVICDHCGKKKVKARMAQHIRISRITSRDYKCEICPLKFKTKFNLEHHMSSHNKPFKCNICKKRFSEQRYFNEHKLNHKKPNPFKCKECSSAYTRKTSLNRHMHTAHSDVRNFACTKCKYKGKTKDDVTTHFKTHTKAYKCDVCSRRFSRVSIFNEHRVIHDNPDAYQCKICLSSFSEKKSLKNHIKNKHDSDEESDVE